MVVRVLQSDREREILIDFKESAHVMVEADKSQICGGGKRAPDPEKSSRCSSSLTPICWQNSLFWWWGVGSVSLFLNAFS